MIDYGPPHELEVKVLREIEKLEDLARVHDNVKRYAAKKVALLKRCVERLREYGAYAEVQLVATEDCYIIPL